MPTLARLGATLPKLSIPWLGSSVQPITFELDANTDLTIPLDSTNRTAPASGKRVFVLGLLTVSAAGGTFLLKSTTAGTSHYLSYPLAANSGIHQPFKLNSPEICFHTETGEALVIRCTSALSGRLYIVEV